MTQNDFDNGRVICLIGVAPVKPAEFMIFRIGQWTADPWKKPTPHQPFLRPGPLTHPPLCWFTASDTHAGTLRA
jgi:hypothetical protein